MKNKILACFLISAFLLSSCAKATQDTSEITSGIFTAVAQTLTAQFTPVEATAVIPETETPTVGPTDTFVPYFTPTTKVVAAATSSCYNSIYTADVTIPDGSVLVVGTAFTKTWTIKNTGSCAWTNTFKLKFASGTQMGGTTTAIGSAVASGNTINVSVTMTAPTTPGTYTGYWRLASDSDAFFGGYVSVNIVVSTVATATVTATGTKTVTPTITPIYVIVTATPTFTPTETPTSTSTFSSGG